MSEGRLEENLALAALVDNAICRNAFDPYLYAEELLRVLQKKPYERTNRDISRLYKFLRQLKFSRTLSDFVVSEISGVGLFVEMEKDRVVFRQGEEGTSWFVILAGAVNVMVANVNGGEDAQHVDNTIVAHLMEGDHFGASALLNERRRAATIMTTEHCLFLKVMKADYNQILKYIHEKEVKEKILLLKSAMPLLGEPQLTAVANVLTMRTVSNNGLVIKEGDPITELFIVKKGQCEAIKNHMVGGRRIHLLMDTLGPGKYFGEATILQNPAKTKPIPSPITLRAVGEVQLGVLQAHDSWSKLRGELPLTSLMQIDEEVVERKYWEYKDKRLWMKYKKQVLEGFMKERQTKVVKKGS
ncbi:hypothetical protein HK102_003200 [Quaeritorhiza haematococci]|nr:hypothetical protein HK102_003200 [Quaeritorhiza haematococci]